MKRFFALLIALLMVSAAACSDDTENGTDNDDSDAGGDTGTEGDTTEADMATDTGAEDTADTSMEDTGGEDAEEEVIDMGPPRECEAIVGQDETTLYDLVTPLQKFIGVAEVIRDGDNVSVDILDETDTFDGPFDEDNPHCFVVSVDAITADLCFYTAQGLPAEAGVLDANLYGFFHGAPMDQPSAVLIGASRRDVDRNCSPGGHFVLTIDDDLAVTGDVPSEVTDTIQDDYLDYIAIFDLGERVSAVVGTEEPVEEIIVDGDPLAGDIQVYVPTGATIRVSEVEVDYDIDFELTGTLDFDTGELTGTVTLTIESLTEEGEITASFVGQRQ